MDKTETYWENEDILAINRFHENNSEQFTE
jgi:hypothetical protein